MSGTATEQNKGGYVVVADAVSFRDPADFKDARPLERVFLTASRGDQLPDGLSDREIKNLKDLGAIAEQGSREAELATAGLPRAAGGPSGAGTVAFASSENEATQVMKAVISGVPGAEGTESSRTDLARLPEANLRIMAKVLGHPNHRDADSKDLIDFVVGRGEDATSRGEIDEQRQARDERQVAARDFGGGRESGLVGTNVRPDGSDREGGRVQTGEAKADKPTRSSSGSDKK